MSRTIFGAPGNQPETNQAVLIRVKNAGELARSQGSLASIAQSLAPATIESQVYSTLRDKLAQSLKDQHVDADVTIVEPNTFRPADDGKHVWQDLAVGVGILGIVSVAFFIATGGKKHH